MCLPVAGLGLLAGIAQGVMGYMGQQQQYQAQEAQYKANFKNAQTATYDKYDAINKRVEQEQAKSSQDLQEASIQGAEARGSARTAAAESHVSGLSVNNVLGEMYARQGRYERSTAVNFDYTRDYWRSEGDAAHAAGQNQVNSVPHGTKPSLFATMLNIFGQSIGDLSSMNTGA
jgi:hypothetical protein